jgi:hypothetical protein
MSALPTTHAFSKLLIQSGVLDENRLERYAQRFCGSPAPSADELAREMVREGVLTAFQARQLLHGRWRRLSLRGKYTVLRPLGSGGSGRVYLCKHRVTGRLVAIKVLSAALSANPDHRERFYREARAITSLEHPNIVRAFDLDRAGQRFLLVMEHVSGSTLQDRVRREGPLPVAQAASVGSQAALGLQYLHSAGLVHRDVKPANLLLDEHGTLKILDFGLSRFMNEDADGLTGRHDPGEILGTADYLAPEQARDTHTAGTSADIYSLGATLYFALTGLAPFHGLTVAQKLLGHQMRQPRPIRSVRPEVPEGLEAVVERMMGKEPSQRFPTAAEVAEALKPWDSTHGYPEPGSARVEMGPCQAMTESAAPAVFGRARPSRVRWAVLLLGAVAAGSLGVVQLFAALRTSAPSQPDGPQATLPAPIDGNSFEPGTEPPPRVTLGIPQLQHGARRAPLLSASKHKPGD